MASVDVGALEGALRSAVVAWTHSLSTPADRQEAASWSVSATDAVARLKALPASASDEERSAAAKEVLAFEDAFGLKMGTLELRGAEQAKAELFSLAQEVIPILLKAIVALLG